MRKLVVFGVLAALTGAVALPESVAAVQQKDGAEAEHTFVALVTGSTGGLGRELALRLAADGAHVIVHGRNAERGNAVVAEIAAAGKGSARFIAADLASFAEVRESRPQALFGTTGCGPHECRPERFLGWSASMKGPSRPIRRRNARSTGSRGGRVMPRTSVLACERRTRSRRSAHFSRRSGNELFIACPLQVPTLQPYPRL